MEFTELLYVDQRRLDAYSRQARPSNRVRRVSKPSASLGLTGPQIGIEQEIIVEEMSNEEKYLSVVKYLEDNEKLEYVRPVGLDRWDLGDPVEELGDDEQRDLGSPFRLEVCEARTLFVPAHDQIKAFPTGFTFWYAWEPPEGDADFTTSLLLLQESPYPDRDSPPIIGDYPEYSSYSLLSALASEYGLGDLDFAGETRSAIRTCFSTTWGAIRSTYGATCLRSRCQMSGSSG